MSNEPIARFSNLIIPWLGWPCVVILVAVSIPIYDFVFYLQKSLETAKTLIYLMFCSLINMCDTVVLVVLLTLLRHTKMTLLLSAPAIFFWGIGTSDIGQDALGWSNSGSAAALAVATIVIPGLDAFCANQIVEQWLDKVSTRGHQSPLGSQISRKYIANSLTTNLRTRNPLPPGRIFAVPSGITIKFFQLSYTGCPYGSFCTWSKFFFLSKPLLRWSYEQFSSGTVSE